MPSTDHEPIGGLSVKPVFRRFVEQELLPAIGMQPEDFWNGLDTLVADLTPTNKELLRVRDVLQQRIDDWHGLHDRPGFNHDEYVEFLRDIDYLREPGEPFEISTDNVDPAPGEFTTSTALVAGLDEEFGW